MKELVPGSLSKSLRSPRFGTEALIPRPGHLEGYLPPHDQPRCVLQRGEAAAVPTGLFSSRGQALGAGWLPGGRAIGFAPPPPRLGWA